MIRFQKFTQPGFLSRCFLVAGMSLLSTLGAAERVDWPQWRGPERTGTSRETGLLASWPEAGPKVLWKIENLGPAYSPVSVVRGRVLTQGNRESREEII